MDDHPALIRDAGRLRILVAADGDGQARSDRLPPLATVLAAQRPGEPLAIDLAALRLLTSSLLAWLLELRHATAGGLVLLRPALRLRVQLRQLGVEPLFTCAPASAGRTVAA